MALDDLSTLRGTINASIGALDGWTKSRWAPDLFGRDTDHVMHLCFVVSVPRTVPMPGRQKVADGMHVSTSVEITWAFRLRGDAQDTDYDGMLDAEQLLVGTLRGITSLHLEIGEMSRRAGPDGWIIGTVQATQAHRYALQ